MTANPSPREIPFNYTSADDRQAISHLLGPERLAEARGAPRRAASPAGARGC